MQGPATFTVGELLQVARLAGVDLVVAGLAEHQINHPIELPAPVLRIRAAGPPVLAS